MMSWDRKPRKCNEGSFSWKKTTLLPQNGSGKFKNSAISRVLKESSLVTSDYSSCSSLSSVSENSIYNSLECLSFVSDREGASELETDEDDDGKKGEINTRRTRTLQHRNVTVVIPEDNLSSHHRNDFYLEFIEDPAFLPCLGPRMVYISHIVSIGPHGSRFYPNKPALIYLPLTERVKDEDVVICLCSNTPKEIPPKWEEMPRENYCLKNGRIVIKAYHFSLFTVVVERPFPEFSKHIDSVVGASLRVPEVNGVEVTFPPGALVNDITAIVRVLYDWDPGQSPDSHGELALASPVIMVGPHGCVFQPGCQPVTVKLPIPHYREIREFFGFECDISVWQSSTSEGEPLVWERLDVEPLIQVDNSGLYTVTFPVSHFSFFKSLWDILSSSLYEAKLGLAFFYPYISFSMMCQAWMEENKDTQRFGLEVICYRSDNKLPEATNYKYKVGSSLKPKLVRPGCIIIRLKSELFDADVEAGEDVEMTKEEPDFRGREFEKQFACRFKQDKPIDKGTFGKVVVERRMISGKNEPLFEFNLHKTGHETDLAPLEGNDRWSVVAITELAGTLQITEEHNWKKFARHIGFTKNEINSKFMYSPDPFLAMVNLYQSRGGTPEEFVQALYAVSRQLRIQGSSGGGGSPTSSTGGSTSKRWPNIFAPRRWRDDDTDSESAASASTSSRKRSHNNSGSSGGTKRKYNVPPPKRKRKTSEVSETMSSSAESSNVDSANPSNHLKLKDTDMWGISEFMNTQNWRALGRTLGLEETVLLNIEHTYKATGFRECAYQMLLQWKERRPTKCTVGYLHTALQKENMNSVAKQLSTMKLGGE